ncbi:unnamed protein product, partial [Effrenium voratum]
GKPPTPEAGSRRPSFAAYGYPPAAATAAHAKAAAYSDPALARVMMEKAFYDGWADAAAAARAGPPFVPPSPPMTPAGTPAAPLVGGVAASLRAHVATMPAVPPSPAQGPLPLSPQVQVPVPKLGAAPAAQVPAGGVIVSGKDSPRSSILKLCGAWGALTHPKPTVKMATDEGFARDRARLLHVRRLVGMSGPPKELVALTCAKI